MSSPAERVARIRTLLAIATRVADPEDPLGREARAALLETAGLSREGLELALRHHLETAASAAELDALVAGASTAPRCHVVLSASVCVAPLRALALALACSETIRLKPSRREPALAAILARELAHAVPEVALEASAQFTTGDTSSRRFPAGEASSLLDVRPGDEVHAYGSDETIAALASTLPRGTVLRGHGHGFGLIVIGPDADMTTDAAAVADDVIAFDQRGCLSPRALIAIGDEARARRVAEAIDAALEAAGRRVPRGPLDPSAQSELTAFARTMAATGELVGGLTAKRDHLVAILDEGAPLTLAPAARALVVHASRDETSARARIQPIARFVTTFAASPGVQSLVDALQRAGARPAALGQMQRPPLDGPVDRRTYPLTL